MTTNKFGKFYWAYFLIAVSILNPGCASYTTSNANLYTRLGGQDAIVAVVDQFITNVAADERINEFFADTDIPELKQQLVAQICAGTGGPCTYTGKDMRSAHAGMNIQESHFNAMGEDLSLALDHFNVAQAEKDELLALLGSMQGDIVNQ